MFDETPRNREIHLLEIGSTDAMNSVPCRNCVIPTPECLGIPREWLI